MNNFWNTLILNNTIREWMIALGIIISCMIILRLIQAIVITRIKVFSANTKTLLDDFIIRIIQTSVMPILYVLTFYFGLASLNLPTRADNILRIATMVANTFFVLRIFTSFFGYFFNKALLRHDKNTQREKQAKGILIIIQAVIWLVGILFLIDNLGYDITTLVAGLGIGGIAIALAAQTILGDLFSYLVIFFDKPFEIGDFITVDDKAGTVEYIGIKTTRIRTLSGEQLICSNTFLTNARVHNYKRMQERRIEFNFGVVYNTPAAKLKTIPPLVQKIIESVEDTRFDRAHFRSFGDFSLNFQVVYIVKTPDYNLYMDKQQTINLKIFELFEKEKIEFAYPTQTLFISRKNEEGQEHSGNGSEKSNPNTSSGTPKKEAAH
jgi:small-conductance mechanosensitive channel